MQRRADEAIPTMAFDTPPSDADRLRAALEALAARDQVLAERTRRLAQLEDAAARLIATAARLEAAEEELAALHRARRSEVAEKDARLAELERRVTGAPPRTATRPVEAEADPEAGSPPDPYQESREEQLQRDLETERRRNFLLVNRGGAGPAGEVRRLQESLDAARRQAAALELRVAEMQADPAGPPGAYAHWEAWFRRRLAERRDFDLARAEETISHQHAVLEEKDRLIRTLLERLRAVGEVSEGPDDLKQISGIGPVIEDLLHGLGITTFEQLAGLAEEDIDRIGDLLGVFRERIRRDHWTEQAADLARRRLRPL